MAVRGAVGYNYARRRWHPKHQAEVVELVDTQR